MNENQIFDMNNESQIVDLDEFYFKVMEKVLQNSDNKQEKFRIVYKALNTFLRKTPELDDTQTCANGLKFLLGLFNNRPVGGFQEGKPALGKSKEKYMSILKQEFCH